MEVDWLQAAIEAPIAVLFAVFLYKCYRARVRLRVDSPCSRCCGLAFKLEMPGEVSRSSSEQGEGERGEDVVDQSAGGHGLAQCDFSTDETRLEEGPTNRDRFQTERCDAREVI